MITTYRYLRFVSRNNWDAIAAAVNVIVNRITHLFQENAIYLWFCFGPCLHLESNVHIKHHAVQYFCAVERHVGVTSKCSPAAPQGVSLRWSRGTPSSLSQEEACAGMLVGVKRWINAELWLLEWSGQKLHGQCSTITTVHLNRINHLKG